MCLTYQSKLLPISYNHIQASSITTYALQCLTPGEECGFRGQFTITENAATAKYTMPAENGEDGVLALYVFSLSSPPHPLIPLNRTLHVQS